MPSVVSNDLKNPVNLALLFFAVVGFLGSAVTVIQFFKPDEVSKLEVEIYPSEFRTPKYSSGALESGEAARDLVRDVRSTACEGLNQDEILKTDRSDLATLSKNEPELEIITSCKNWTEIEFAARWAGEYSESDGEMLRYEVKNTGRKVAEDIRIRATQLNSLQYKIGNAYIEATKGSDEEYFEIPDLNPNESVTILAWSSSFLITRTYSDWDDYPPITFAGSEVHTELFKPVPDGWFNFHDNVRDMPIIILGVFVVFFSLLVVLLTWLTIAIPTALLTGKSLSDVFDPDTKSESTTDEDETD